METPAILNSVLFYFFAALAILSGALMVTRRNVVHGAIFLITALLATAGIYLQLQAEFLFAVQIILYVGGIMVLFVFVIMLVNLDVTLRQVQFNRQRWVAGILSLVLGVEIFLAFWKGGSILHLPAVMPGIMGKNTEAVGTELFRGYMLPFEIASVLLLVAMIGAVVMSKKKV
ncbi:MAG: NADH-quinone oxidoreductase subunit J family protein [Candidatus Acidiferrales bacterium]